MTISILHSTQAVGVDAGNGEIRKAQWNENHSLQMATARLVGRTTAGAGAAEEIVVNSTLSLAGGQLSFSTSWGDARYLQSESDPVFSASAAAGISLTDITNWDTAYGWGDHASAGYALASAIPTNVSDLTNDLGYITGYTVTQGDVTAHQAALQITKSQITDLSSATMEYVLVSANYTASDQEGIIADTSGGPFTLTLPPSPTAGFQVAVADGADWAINPLVVARNGSTIEGMAENLVLDMGNVYVFFLYSGSTWKVYAQAVSTTGTIDGGTY